MPFTPFHFGSSLFIISIVTFLDPLALFIGSIAPDIEGITALFILPHSNLPLHGPFHSFPGAIILGLVSGFFSFFFWKIIRINSFTYQSIQIQFTLSNGLISGLIGSFSHILLDAPLYPEMNLFYPIHGNFLYQTLPFSGPYLFCVIAGFTGLIILFYKISTKNFSQTS